MLEEDCVVRFLDYFAWTASTVIFIVEIAFFQNKGCIRKDHARSRLKYLSMPARQSLEERKAWCDLDGVLAWWEQQWLSPLAETSNTDELSLMCAIVAGPDQVNYCGKTMLPHVSKQQEQLLDGFQRTWKHNSDARSNLAKVGREKVKQLEK